MLLFMINDKHKIMQILEFNQLTQISGKSSSFSDVSDTVEKMDIISVLLNEISVVFSD